MGENTETNQTQTDSTTSGSTPELETEVTSTETSSNPGDVTSSSSDTEINTQVPVPDVTESAEPVVTEEVASEEVAPITTAEVAPEASSPELSNVRQRVITQYAIATIIILVMGAGLLYALEEQGRVSTGVFDSVTELVKPAPAAAIVNGVKIPLAQYEKNREQLIQTATLQGLDPTNESIATQINAQALDVLVNTELLRQAALAEGITVTKEDIDTRYEEIVATLGGEEQLATKMTELNITPESLRVDIEGEILIKKHLDTAVDLSSVTIDQKEVQAVYDQANTPGADIPPFAEVKAQIEAQLKATKEQEKIGKYIETLKTEAEIETKI